MDLTAARARELFFYDPLTGKMTWRVSLNARAPAGAQAGTLGHNGRLRVTISGRRYLVHRVAWLMTFGHWPDDEVDHKNLIPSDNRLCNLRVATHSQNNANKSPSRDLPKGVSFEPRTGRWRSRIRVARKEIALGHFDTMTAAHEAYARAAEEHFGAFARAA